MKGNFIKRLSSFILATAMMMGTAVTASAEETAVTGQSIDESICDSNVASIASMSTRSSTLGTVPAGGTAEFRLYLPSYVGFTKQFHASTTCLGESSGAIMIQLYNESGKLVSDDWIMGTNEPNGVYWTLFLPSSGTYTIKVIGHATDKNVSFGAWWQ